MCVLIFTSLRSYKLLFIGWQINHGVTEQMRLSGTSGCHLVKQHCSSRDTLSRVPRIMSRWQDSPDPFLQSCLPAGWSLACTGAWGPPKVQDFALFILEFREVLCQRSLSAHFFSLSRSKFRKPLPLCKKNLKLQGSFTQKPNFWILETISGAIKRYRYKYIHMYYLKFSFLKISSFVY